MAVLGLVFVLGLAGLVSYCYKQRQQRRAPQHPDHDRSEAASLTSREHEDRGDDVIGMANANAQPLADPPADVVDRAEAQVHAAPPADWERLMEEADAAPPSPPWADDLSNPFRAATETGNDPFRVAAETENDPFQAAAEREDPGLRESPEGEGASGSSVLYVDRRMQVEI